MIDPKIKIIQHYLNQISEGVMTISEVHAMDIIDIVRGKTPFAKLYRWTSLKEEYEFIQNIPINEIQMNKAVLHAASERPIEDAMYKFAVFNTQGELQTFIFTLNPDFFNYINHKKDASKSVNPDSANS